MVNVTFWKSDFLGENLNQLESILKDYAVKGIGCSFILKETHITALLPSESDYVWIMDNVANYGNPNINK